MSLQSLTLTIISSLFVFMLSGCDNKQEASATPIPIAIENGIECDLCGMYINRFPGPKGQLFERGSPMPRHFCSTRDMFAYALQLEHSHRIEHIFVHDVATAAWDQQGDAKYIDAKKAIFVVDHKLKGAMGPTLASFSTASDAQSFITENGGRILSFEHINNDTLNSMTSE